MENRIKFQCIKCAYPLVKTQDFLKCNECGAKWKIIDNVPHFIDKDLYWGEIPQDEMYKINEQITNKYWKDALRDNKSKEAQNQYKLITNLKRANWHYLLPLSKDAVILDIGSGMGTISEALAHNYGTIVALEPVYERVVFSNIRFKQEGLNNIQVVRADAVNLPFPENSFDLVVMNGVLEWVGLSDTSLSPEEVQTKVLKNILRVLKPGGYIYIGIENRFSFGYIGGQLDHSYLKYTSLMPRKIASIYTKVKKGQDYRTYTYSHFGYRNILKAARFTNIEFYTAIPSYNQPDYIIPLDRKPLHLHFKYHYLRFRTFKGKLMYLLARIFSMIGLAKYFIPAYIIFAKKDGKAKESALTQYILTNWGKWGLGKRKPEKNLFFTLNFFLNKILILFFTKEGKFPTLAIKISENREGDNTLRNEYNNTVFIRSKTSEEIKHTIPFPYSLTTLDNHCILIESFLGRKRLVPINPQPVFLLKRRLYNDLNLVKQWLTKFHISMRERNITFDDNQIIQLVKKPINTYCANGNSAWIREKCNSLITKAETLKGLELPYIPQHGDFFPGNISKQDNHICVYDWGYFGSTYLPLFDLFHFITFYLLTYFEKKKVNSLDSVLEIYFRKNWFTPYLVDCIEDYCKRTGVPLKFICLLFPLYLITFSTLYHTDPIRKEVIRLYDKFIFKYFENEKNYIFVSY